MIDGIINETMNSRKILAVLPATYEEFVALALSSGVPADIIISEEGWRQLPTWLNKANLLSDITEVAVFGNASNRTVDAALKMLADVAYGRVATLKLTVLDTDGNPIPDVTVKLDATPTVGVDEITDENGQITISTDGGTHTANLIYPLGYSAEKGSITVEVSGTREETVRTVSRSFGSYKMISTAKTFYIARYLSPVQFHVHGGGGSGGIHFTTYFNSSGNGQMQGGAGGYYQITDAIDTIGKLIHILPGSGGARKETKSPSSKETTITQLGNRGGTTTLTVGETTYSAKGGAGGGNSTSNNEDGGAYGGGKPATSLAVTGDGEDGPNLFNDSTLEKIGSGGGGAYIRYSSDNEDFVNQHGSPGESGGTGGISYDIRATDVEWQISTEDATVGGGTGAIVLCTSTSYAIKRWSGKGGDGFVAFRKAV